MHCLSWKVEKINRGRNWTARARRNQNSWREKIANTCEYWKRTSPNKNKIRKEFFKRTRKFLENKTLWQIFHKWDLKKCLVLLVRFNWRGIISDKWKRKLIKISKTLHLRDDIDNYMSQEKKEEDDLPALKIVWLLHYEESKTALKGPKDLSQRPIRKLTT